MRGGGEAGADGAASPPPRLPASPLDVLDTLARLVDRSLVQAQHDAGGETRYRLLETVRQYAGERLTASGEAEAVRARHAAYVVALVEAIEPQRWGPHEAAWLAQLEREHDNVRAALGWALDRRDGLAALRLAGAVYQFWLIRGHSREGRAWLGRSPGGGRPRRRRAPGRPAGARDGAARRRRAGRPHGATTPRRARSSARRTPCAGPRATGGARRCRSRTWRGASRTPATSTPRAPCRRRPWRSSAASATRPGSAGRCAIWGCSPGSRETTTPPGACSRRAWRWPASTRSPSSLGLVLARLGGVLGDIGELGAARARLMEALQVAVGLGNAGGVGGFLFDELAILAARQARPERALRLFGAAEALSETAGRLPVAGWRAERDRQLAAARQALAEEAGAAAWAAGRAMTLEQAVAYAQTEDEAGGQALSLEQAVAEDHDLRRADPRGAPAPTRPAPPALAGLTRREVEVLRLLARARPTRRSRAS